MLVARKRENIKNEALKYNEFFYVLYQASSLNHISKKKYFKGMK